MAALAVLAAGGTASAADPPSIVIGADGETAPVFSYTDAIRERVFIPIAGVDQDSDGVTDQVVIDINRPLETSSGLKVPAIIDPSPYYTSVGRGNETEYIHTTAAGVLDKFPLYYDNFFVPRGYAFIAAQAVGTAFSTGCPLHGGPGDVAGFKAVVDWLRGRVPGYDKDGKPVTATWDNGKNAMIGKSYDGTFANGVASTGVEGLTTIVPISAISDWYDYSRMGGIRFNTHYPATLSNSITQTTTNTTALGVAPPSRNALCLASRNAMSTVDGDTDGDINSFWQDRNYNLNVGKVQAAVFATHGLNDDNVRLNHFSQWWAGLAANNVPRKVWLSQEGHVDPFDYRRAAWVDTLHRWFDYWLQGVQNGIMNEPQADIETGPNTWETAASWPLPGTKPIDVYLQGQAAGNPGALGLTTGGASDALTFTGANLTETNYLALATSQANRLLFLSPALTHDLRISGTPVVDIRASLSTTQSNLSAWLVDYGGGVLRVNRTSGDGVQDLATSSCWGDSTAADDACYVDVGERTTTPTVWRVSKGILDSSNRDSLFTGEAAAAVAGRTYEFKWPTLPNDFTFPTGHQLGIVIGASFSGFTSVVGTAAATITVDTRASKVVLPVVGGYSAARGSGAFTADTTAPTLHLPADITVDATSPAGAVVTYTATATDNEDPSPTVDCTPASGSTFPTGTTTVHCTATDASTNSSTGSFTVHVNGSSPAINWAANNSVDFDADHVTDFALYRGLSPADSLWYAPGTAGSGPFQIYFGATSDIPVPGDYDGDGKTDAVIYRPSTGLWYGPRTGAAQIVIQMVLGEPGDIPIPGDYNGDGKTDPAIYRPSTGLFFGTNATGSQVVLNTTFGAAGDVPVPRDYDGDGKTDPGIYRQDVTPEHYSLWYAPLSGGGVHQIYFGAPGDIPVPADYDGDRKADSVIFRPSTGLWYGPRTGAAQIVIQMILGQNGDVPIPGYYDADPATDPAVYRPSSGLWFSVLSGGGTRSIGGLGTPADVPIQKRPARAGGM